MISQQADALTLELIQLAKTAGGPILGLDTSGSLSALCLVDIEPHERIWHHVVPADALPSEGVAELLAAQAESENFDFASLKAIVVGTGPGSFTGVRVGLAIAKGLSIGANVPLYGVSSLKMLAVCFGAGLIAPVLDARRGALFCALYQVNENGQVQELLTDDCRTPQQFANAIKGVVGNMSIVKTIDVVGFESSLEAELVDISWRLSPMPEPSMLHGIGLAAAAISQKKGCQAHQLLPHYRRAPAVMSACKT